MCNTSKNPYTSKNPCIPFKKMTSHRPQTALGRKDCTHAERKDSTYAESTDTRMLSGGLRADTAEELLLRDYRRSEVTRVPHCVLAQERDYKPKWKTTKVENNFEMNFVNYTSLDYPS